MVTSVGLTLLNAKLVTLGVAGAIVVAVIVSTGGILTRNETIAPDPLAGTQSGSQVIAVMKAGMTAFLITGDADRNKVQTMPGGNTATIEIRLPANWDELMAKLGYRPLQEFFLAEKGAD